MIDALHTCIYMHEKRILLKVDFMKACIPTFILRSLFYSGSWYKGVHSFESWQEISCDNEHFTTLPEAIGGPRGRTHPLCYNLRPLWAFELSSGRVCRLSWNCHIYNFVSYFISFLCFVWKYNLFLDKAYVFQSSISFSKYLTTCLSLCTRYIIELSGAHIQLLCLVSSNETLMRWVQLWHWRKKVKKIKSRILRPSGIKGHWCLNSISSIAICGQLPRSWIQRQLIRLMICASWMSWGSSLPEMHFI